MSSLGFYVTAETYNGRHDYSLKLDGQDPYFNTAARNRGIVMHGADYVSEKYIEGNGRLGRSFGCPAIPSDVSHDVVDLIKDGSCLFIYAKNSRYLNQCRHLDEWMAAQVFQDQGLNLANRKDESGFKGS